MANRRQAFVFIFVMIWGFTSTACAVQDDSSNLVPNNSVVFVQSRSFGGSAGNIESLGIRAIIAARLVETGGRRSGPRSDFPTFFFDNTFLTNHTHVLVLLARNPLAVVREVALEVGSTERAVQRIVADLERSGFIQKERAGRQNQYRIDPQRKLRHPIESHREIGDLLELANQGRPNGK